MVTIACVYEWCVRVCMCVLCVCVASTRAHLHTHTKTHTYVHTCKHTHTHTHTQINNMISYSTATSEWIKPLILFVAITMTLYYILINEVNTKV